MKLTMESFVFTKLPRRPSLITLPRFLTTFTKKFIKHFGDYLIALDNYFFITVTRSFICWKRFCSFPEMFMINDVLVS